MFHLGKCFLSAGVESVNTTDDAGKERFLPLPYGVFLNGGISSFHWIWSQSWNRVRTVSFVSVLSILFIPKHYFIF